MERTEECTCDCMMTGVCATEFVIIGTRIELRCKNCNGLIGWWKDLTKREVPFKRTWSHEERLAMR